MATPRGLPNAPLERELFEAPYRFDFFQAVRLLERRSPSRKRIGREGSPRQEAVRFHAVRGLAFPASAIQRLEDSDDPDRPPAMSITFLGLTGPQGVLPYCYTELVMERNRAGDRTLAAFLDLFHHRLASLFYRAWQKHHLAALEEQEESSRFSAHLFDLIGLGMEPLRNRHAFPDEALPFFAGAFAQRHRSAVMLERLLIDYFELPVAVCQFEGRWLRLAPDDRSRLGASGRFQQLGVSLVVGEKVRDEQGKFRLRIGPLSFPQFLALSPDGPDFRALTQMTRLFVQGELDYDVQLVLKAEEVPDCQLSSTPEAGARLGRHAWLKSRPLADDARDAVFAAGA